jgi:hypothetical protein
VTQVGDTAENRRDAPPRPAQCGLDLRERPRDAGGSRQLVEQRSHQLAAAIAKQRDLACVRHGVVRRVLYGADLH